jgi:sentrin-specific protease 1
LSKCIREQVEFKDLRLLNNGQWLNDEVINFYMALLQERADQDLIVVDGQKKKRRDIHCFNSFFYAKLADDYAKSKVGRWTKKVCNAIDGLSHPSTS